MCKSTDSIKSFSEVGDAWAAFLTKYYNKEIIELGNDYPDRRSLKVEFIHIDNFNSKLAEGVLSDPDTFLDPLIHELRNFDLVTGTGLEKAHVRIMHLPVVKGFEEINPEAAGGKLISIAGVVLRVRRPEDKIKTAVFECPYCAHIFSVVQPPFGFIQPPECPQEEGGCGRRVKAFKLLMEKCEIVRTQQFSFQEVRGKEKREIKEIEVEDDLINQVSLGENIIITGIVRYYQRKNINTNTPYVDWIIDVNSLEKVIKVYNETTRGKAIELLKDPDILDSFAKFLEKPGLIEGRPKRVIVGEDKNKKLLFLSGLSAKLRRKINNILIGQSSVGKSRLVSLLNLFFPNQVEDLFRASARALDYLEINLEGKILLLTEMAGGQSAQYSLRITMDPESDELRIFTVIKDEKTNEQKTVEKVTKGSPVFVSTTTSAHFDIQTKNRAFLSPMDETEDQTKKIFGADDRGRKEILSDLTSERDMFLCALDMLQPIEVKVPFTTSYPTKNLKARRSRSHLLDLVEVITFLHQYQRNFVEIGEKESELHRYLIATHEDFDLAKEIASKSLSMDVEGLSPNAEKLFELFKEEGWDYSGKREGESQNTLEEETEKSKMPFTIKSIRERVSKYLGRSYSKTAIRGFLDELDDANRIVSDDSKPKHYYILDESGERTEMNTVQVDTVRAKEELSVWLDAMNGKHTFYRCESGKKLFQDIHKIKSVHADYSNGAIGDTQTGERKGDNAQSLKACIPEGDKEEAENQAKAAGSKNEKGQDKIGFRDTPTLSEKKREKKEKPTPKEIRKIILEVGKCTSCGKEEIDLIYVIHYSNDEFKNVCGECGKRIDEELRTQEPNND